MKTLLLFFLCSTLYAETGFLAQQAQLAWKDRDKPGQTEEAIHLWEQAVKAEPGRTDYWIAFSKALGRGVRHAKSRRERRRWADQAKEAARKAVERDPSSAEAFAAYGEALGQWANQHKGVSSLDVVRQAVDALEKAVSIKPKYAYAHMLLAEFYRQSPRMISVGNKEKALHHARLAAEYGPTYAINHLVLADAYLDVGKEKEGVAELQEILTLTPPSDAIPETRADQETARTKLHTLGIEPTPNPKKPVVLPTPPCDNSAGYCAEQP